MKTKLIFVLLLVLVIGICLVACDNDEVDDDQQSQLAYTLNEDGESYCVTGRGNFSGKNLKIPKSYKGKPITTIGASAFESCSTIYSVVIPDSVTEIHSEAFAWCYNLTSVTVGSNVTFIGNSAFSGCLKLVEIYNKSNLSIDCGSSTCGGIALYAKNVYTTKYESKLSSRKGFVTYKDEGGEVLLLAYTSSEKEITLPSTVTKICDYALYCSDVTSVIIPDSVKEIGYNAFKNCANIVGVYIGKGVENIESNAFYACSALKSINIPSNVKTIGSHAFYACTALQDVEFSNNSLLQRLEMYTFSECSALQKIDFASNGSLKYIDGYAFNKCEALKEIVIPNSVTNIESFAFYGCNNLKSISLPFVGETKDSQYNGFFGCIFGATDYSNNSSSVPYSLKNVVITGGSKIIDHAFQNCIGIESISLPDSLAEVGSNAFSGCYNLKKLTFGANSQFVQFYSNTFNQCSNLTEITIPSSVIRMYYGIFYDSQISDVYFTGTVAVWQSRFSNNGWDNGLDDYTVHCTDGTISKDGKVTYTTGTN